VDNLDELLNPESNALWNLVLAAVVLAVSFWIARVVRRRIRAVLEKYDLDESASALLSRSAGWGVVLLGLILALSIMGYDMVPVALVVVAILGLIALSGKSLFENWGAGLLLQARGPYKVGDRIEVLGNVGFVEVTNLRSVILRTGDGQIIHIPNSDVLSNPLTNRTGDDGLRRSSLTFATAYGTDVDDVERLLMDAASATDGVLTEPSPPTAWIASLGDTTVNIELRFWHQHADRHEVRSAVGHASLVSLAAAGLAVGEPSTAVVVSGSLDCSATASE
jgi:small conductance mechanosensitive channel